MLAILGFLMIIVFMILIMTGRLTAMIALMVVPITFAVIGGFGSEMGPMMLDGIKSVAPTWDYDFICHSFLWYFD